RGRAGTGLRLVQQSVLAALLPPDGQEAGRADIQLDRRRRALDRDPDADLLGLAVGQDRPEADHPGWDGPGRPDVLSVLHRARDLHESRSRQLPDGHSDRRDPVNYVGMVYGPIGAFLAEFFPSRIRYTSVSVPYHIGNGWGGGLVPIVT